VRTPTKTTAKPTTTNSDISSHYSPHPGTDAESNLLLHYRCAMKPVRFSFLITLFVLGDVYVEGTSVL
jgi:hypothetical protein